MDEAYLAAKRVFSRAAARRISRESLSPREQLEHFQTDEEQAIEWVHTLPAEQAIDAIGKRHWPGSVPVWLELVARFGERADVREHARRLPGMHLAEGHLIWEALHEQPPEDVPFLETSPSEAVLQFEEQLLGAKRAPPVSLFKAYARALPPRFAAITMERAVMARGREASFWIDELGADIAMLERGVLWCPGDWRVWAQLLRACELGGAFDALRSVHDRAMALADDANDAERLSFLHLWMESLVRTRNRGGNVDELLVEAACHGDSLAAYLAQLDHGYPRILSTLRASVAVAEALVCTVRDDRDVLMQCFRQFATQSALVRDAWIRHERLHGTDLRDMLAVPPLHAGDHGRKRTHVAEEAASDDASCVFVSNLDYHVQLARLRRFFAEELRLDAGGIKMYRHPDGKFRGFARVQLGGADAVQRALAFDRRPLDGRPAYISPFNAAEHQHEGAVHTAASERRTLYVSNLPPSTTEASLRRLFAPFSGIRDIRLVTRHSGRFRGCAYIEFASPRNAERARAGMDGHEVADSGEERPWTIAVAFSNPPKSALPPAGPSRRLATGAVAARGSTDDAPSAAAKPAGLRNVDFRARFGLQ